MKLKNELIFDKLTGDFTLTEITGESRVPEWIHLCYGG